MSPSPSLFPSAALLGRRVWLLVVLLGGLGMILVGVALGEVASMPLPANMAAPVSLPDKMRPVLRMAPAQTEARRVGKGAWSATTTPAGGGQALDSTVCLAADLAAGRRTESTHRATVALPLPGACGDLREALAGMALAHRGHPDLVTDFGPPDRQPGGMLLSEVVSGRMVRHAAIWSGRRRGAGGSPGGAKASGLTPP
jgi:hypothetical protein